MHVEALYLWLDRANAIEFGWSLDRAGFFTGPRTVFHARLYNGKYHGQDVETGDQLDGDRYLAMFRVPADRRYRFSKDGVTYPANVNRAPHFKGGTPLAVGEIFDQCDPGSSRWWSLDFRASNDTNTWYDWGGIRRTCDNEKHYDYQSETRDGFRIVAGTAVVTDNYCVPFR